MNIREKKLDKINPGLWALALKIAQEASGKFSLIIGPGEKCL